MSQQGAAGAAYPIPARKPGERDYRPCVACGDAVEAWAITADRRLPQLCDGCQRASTTRPGRGLDSA